jgi:hypothetical protein
MNTAIKNGFVPTYYKQESQIGFILHEAAMEKSGVYVAAQNGFNSLLMPKTMGRWSSSRFAWDTALMHAAMHAHYGITGMLIALEHPDKIDVFDNIDVGNLIYNVIGLDRSIKDVEDLSAWIKSHNVPKNPTETTKSLATLLKASTYCTAISVSMSQGNDKPTIEDLQEFVSEHGIGFTRWVGTEDFFGWDGDPASLESIAPAPYQGEESNEFCKKAESNGIRVQYRTLVNGMHLINSAASHSGESVGGAGLITALADPMHRKCREMNWHLEQDLFNKHPYSVDDGNKVESKLYRTGGETEWIGKNLEYLRKEGISAELQFAAVVVLNPHFVKHSQFFAKSSGIYKEQDGHQDHLWIGAIGECGHRMISQFGITSANIIEELQVGYFASPKCLYMNADGKNENSAENLEYIKAVMSDEPLQLDPVFSSDLLQQVATPGEQRDAFAEYIQIAYLPDSTKDQVLREIDKALVKLGYAHQNAYEVDWMKTIRTSALEHGTEVSEDSADTSTFLESLDSFCKSNKLDFVHLLKKVKDTNSKNPEKTVPIL